MPTPSSAEARRQRAQFLRFEHRSEPLLSDRAYLIRLLKSAGVGATLMLVSLGGGMFGYHALEGLPWIDSFVEASMLMGGMGPVAPLHTPGGKLFAGLYALYCGLVLILVAGILLAPIAHRILHKFHAQTPAD